MDDAYNQPIVDRHGSIMFYCSFCGTPIGRDDIIELGMRLPDFGETAEEYRDAELVDAFQHRQCLGAARAS